MGEVDEARFAIVKTLHGMIRDVETDRYLEWVAKTYGKPDGVQIDGNIVEGSERWRDTFLPGGWVKVPDTKIAGTQVSKYGKLSGKYVPGPVWNDVRSAVNVKRACRARQEARDRPQAEGEGGWVSAGYWTAVKYPSNNQEKST